MTADTPRRSRGAASAPAAGASAMADTPEPTAIKKYANRRLYNTGTSTYVTLDDLAEMVRKGEEFVVTDAKSNEDITRSVLTQIIFELENKGQNLLPVSFLRQLIRFYGDQMQVLVPSYLQFSLDHLTREQESFRAQMQKAMGGDIFGVLQEQARANMTIFQESFRLFNPFAHQAKQAAEGEETELSAMKRDLDAMRERIDRIGRK
jgi:polyhydroxyalkanoate synthesis repressor PhaR